MCTNSCHMKELANIAATGSTSVTRPSTIRKPCGWFIQAFTVITMNEPVTPVIAIGMPLARCQRGDSRSQP